jgi:hypothetical protein
VPAAAFLRSLKNKAAGGCRRLLKNKKAAAFLRSLKNKAAGGCRRLLKNKKAAAFLRSLKNNCPRKAAFLRSRLPFENRCAWGYCVTA